jgi:hypothetical protein
MNGIDVVNMSVHGGWRGLLGRVRLTLARNRGMIYEGSLQKS